MVITADGARSAGVVDRRVRCTEPVNPRRVPWPRAACMRRRTASGGRAVGFQMRARPAAGSARHRSPRYRPPFPSSPRVPLAALSNANRRRGQCNCNQREGTSTTSARHGSHATTTRPRPRLPERAPPDVQTHQGSGPITSHERDPGPSPIYFSPPGDARRDDKVASQKPPIRSLPRAQSRVGWLVGLFWPRGLELEGCLVALGPLARSLRRSLGGTRKSNTPTRPRRPKASGVRSASARRPEKFEPAASCRAERGWGSGGWEWTRRRRRRAVAGRRRATAAAARGSISSRSSLTQRRRRGRRQ